MRIMSSVLPVFGLVVLAACGGGGDGGTPPTPVPASVSVAASATGPFTALGQTRTLTATVKDASGATISSPVSWSSNATGVATVSGSGATAVATSVGNGSARITATAGTVSGSVDLTVAQELSGVAVTPTSATIFLVGSPGSVTISAEPQDATGHAMVGQGAASFASNNTAVATVNATTGVVTPVAVGSAGIIATIGGHASAPAVITVQQQQSSFPLTADVSIAGLSFSPASVDIAAGGTVTWHFNTVEHNVTWDGSAPTGGNIPTTTSANVARSFPNAGSYAYHCSIHGQAMSGTVTVH